MFEFILDHIDTIFLFVFNKIFNRVSDKLEHRTLVDDVKDETVLSLAYCDIKEDYAKCIAQTLKDGKVVNLSLRRSHISYDSLKCLSNVLKDTRITRFELFRCFIKDEGIIYLAKVLKNTKITNLNLNCVGLTCNGLKYLADVLPDTKITHLSLSMNNIRDEGLNYLTSVLKDTKIIDLGLVSNSFGHDAALRLNKMLNSTRIEKLSLHISCTKSDARGPTCVQQFSRLHDKTKMYHEITIENCNIEIYGFHYFNEILKNSEIYRLCINSELKKSTAEYLAQAFKDVVIHDLDAWKAGEYTVQAFKGSYITLLRMRQKRGFRLDLEDLQIAEKLLEKANILIFCIFDCRLGNDNMSALASAIKKSSVMEITLHKCCAYSTGVVEYLPPVLRDSKVMRLDVTGNYIGDGIDGIKYLADCLPGSQVTHFKLDKNFIENSCVKPLLEVIENTNLVCVEFDGNTKFDSLIIKRRTISIADKLCNSFKTIVSLNQAHGKFEFVLPKDSFEQYIFLIKTLLENSNSKVHIFYMMCRYEDPWDPNKFLYDHKMMKKIDDFVSTIISKFNTFFNDRLSDLIESICTDCIQCVNIVKQFEEAQLGDIVQNLLLHRVLYSVDENQEILHPFIYKLLNKYSMPLYNERVEPDKMEKIISYFQNHPEIDGAKEIVDFLRTKSCDNFCSPTEKSVSAMYKHSSYGFFRRTADL